MLLCSVRLQKYESIIHFILLIFCDNDRTETDFFKEGFELLPLLEDHRNHNVWGNFVTLLLNNGKYQWPRHGGHDDQGEIS